MVILIRENIEVHTDDEKQVAELKEQGYVEVKRNDKRPRSKGTGKARKADSK